MHLLELQKWYIQEQPKSYLRRRISCLYLQSHFLTLSIHQQDNHLQGAIQWRVQKDPFLRLAGQLSCVKLLRMVLELEER